MTPDMTTPSPGGRIISSKSSLILDLPPSCVEFCPADPFVFVVGTYNLEKEESLDAGADAEAEADTNNANVSEEKTLQSRNGSLLVFRLDNDAPAVMQTIAQPSAILDIHFGTLPECRNVLGVVSSTGTFSAFKFDPRNPSVSLHEMSTSRIPTVGEGVLFLSLAWHPWRQDSVAITTSDGEAYLIKLDPSTYSIKSNRKLAVQNTLQCWCIAFSPDSGVTATEDQEDQGYDRAFTVYTGGDDSVLRYSSYTMGKIFNQDEERADSEEGLVGEIKKIHNAGVTAILPLPIVLLSGGRVVVTGSYDDTIRALAVHDPRPELGIRPAKLLAEAYLGGGVWRLKIISIKSSATAGDECSWQVRLLASCMHAGSRIVNLHIPASGDGAGVNVTGRFEEHKSMNYGSDFTRTLGGTALAISTSFYDRLLCTWEWDMEQ